MGRPPINLGFQGSFCADKDLADMPEVSRHYLGHLTSQVSEKTHFGTKSLPVAFRNTFA